MSLTTALCLFLLLPVLVSLVLAGYVTLLWGSKDGQPGNPDTLTHGRKKVTK